MDGRWQRSRSEGKEKKKRIKKHKINKKENENM